VQQEGGVEESTPVKVDPEIEKIDDAKDIQVKDLKEMDTNENNLTRDTSSSTLDSEHSLPNIWQELVIFGLALFLHSFIDGLTVGLFKEA
jgi:zinc transporter ZupT